MGKVYSVMSYVFWRPLTESEAMFKAVKDDDSERLEEMVRNGADVTQLNDEGLTLLHYAAELGRQQCVKVLMFYNCFDPNVRDSAETPMGPLQTTPLHLAAAEGFSPIVVCLLEYGADINAITINGWTPLHYMIITETMSSRKMEVLSVLIGMGADTTRRDADGNLAVDIAVLYGHYEVTRILLNTGIDVDSIGPIDPNFIKSSKVFECVELCLKAGSVKVIEKYDVIKYLIEGTESNDEEREDLTNKINCLLSYKTEVQSLKFLCRISVRKNYPGHNLNTLVDKLPVPHSLRWYLLLIDN